MVGRPKHAPQNPDGQQLAHVPGEHDALVPVEHVEREQEDQREQVAVEQRHLVPVVEPEADRGLLQQCVHGCRWSVLPVAGQFDEDVLERALAHLEVEEIDTPRASTSDIRAANRPAHGGRLEAGAVPLERQVLDARSAPAASPASSARHGRQRDGLHRRGLRQQLLRRAGRDDLPVVDDRDAVAELFRFLDVVRGEQDGITVLLHADDLPMR